MLESLLVTKASFLGILGIPNPCIKSLQVNNFYDHTSILCYSEIQHNVLFTVNAANTPIKTHSAGDDSDDALSVKSTSMKYRKGHRTQTVSRLQNTYKLKLIFCSKNRINNLNF